MAGDDWYRRRQDDQVGDFSRRVVSQGPRKGEGGDTQQGLYCFTAAGDLLQYGHSRYPEGVKEMLREALEKWNGLNEQVRKPRKFQEKVGELDSQYAPQPPKNGLTLRVHARTLERKEDGNYRVAKLPPFSRRSYPRNLAALDHLWLREKEWRSLVPDDPSVGREYPVPPAVVQRLVRFHLIDNTRGEASMWRDEDVKEADLRLRVEKVEPLLTLKLSGSVKLENSRWDRGYDATLDGVVVYDPRTETFERFDVVALGDHWGRGKYTWHPRPGKTPLGIAFEFADGTSEADKIPPQAARDLRRYFED